MKENKHPKERLKSIGKYAKACRLEKKMSMEQLSEISNVSAATISRLENGKAVGSNYLAKVFYALQLTAYLPFSILEKKLYGEIMELSEEDKYLVLRYITKLKNLPLQIIEEK